ncbi:MAG: hypothetical protein QXZ70_03305 [Candidatus Bathyarchaeia archaeon]
MPKPKTTKLSVFKGREAKLNHAIFQTLAHKSPQTIYDIHKQIKTYRGYRRTKYANVNKRVKALEDSGYVIKVGTRKTKAGFLVSLYELTFRAYLAILLDSINFETLLTHLDDATAASLLASIINVAFPDISPSNQLRCGSNTRT